MMSRKAMLRSTTRLVLVPALLLSLLPAAVQAQQSVEDLPNAPTAQAQSSETATLRHLPRNLLHDQAAIWTSPAHLNSSNAAGPIVLVLATAALATTDHQVMSKHFLDPNLNKHAVTASNGLVGALIAAPAALFAVGELFHNDHAYETGILAGEAMGDSLIVNEGMKAVSMRERPTLDGARGKFFQTSVGLNSSFPSNHSILAWSSAAVLTEEYDGPLTKLTAYGLATGVSVARVVGREHFPSDVLVGSAVGWLIGRYVYHRHHLYE